MNIDVEPNRKKRQGSFWKWFLRGFPDLNLERFMIFRELNKQAVHIINKDNCFIYACRMSGLSDEVINALRYSVHKRSMSTSDINEVCKTYQLKVHVKEPGRSYTINPDGIHDIRMIRFHEHYMIDEPVDVSPYYILHRSEIMKEKPFMPRYRKTRVIGKSNGKYVVAPIDRRFSLMTVLNALFKVGAFVPITMNDYRVYSSLVCFENIDPIKNLDYDSKFCVKLKQIKSSQK